MQIEISKQEEKAVKLLYFLWKSIDHEGMGASRRMGLWDEFQAKIQFAANSNNPERFLEVFARKFGIGAFKRPEIIIVLAGDTIETVREKPRKLVLLLRNLIEIEKKEYKARTERKEAYVIAKDMFERFDRDWKQLLEETKEEK